jgi:3D (Asp-Asp-Asp) domain-containing protein
MKNITAKIPGLLKRSPVETVLAVAVIAVLAYVLAPLTAGAVALVVPEDKTVALSIEAMQNQTKTFGQLPESQLRGPYTVMQVEATAYNSVPGQTDDTPFITASGTHVRPGVLAANFLPIGTHVTIPDIYGDQVFIVEDRMNPRYDKRVDIWMESLTDARQFGVKTITLHVYGE